jgi:hypothetical protein
VVNVGCLLLLGAALLGCKAGVDKGEPKPTAPSTREQEWPYAPPREVQDSAVASPSPDAYPGATPVPPAVSAARTAAAAQVERLAYAVEDGLLVDGDHGLLYGRRASRGLAANDGWHAPDPDAEILLIDQADLTLRRHHSASGIMALDAPRRRLYVDDVDNGLLVLDADTLTELRRLPLPTPVVSDTGSLPDFRPLAPLADTVAGHVLVARGASVSVLDPDTGHEIRQIGDGVGPEHFLLDAQLDPVARRLYVERLRGPEDCYMFAVDVETYDVDSGQRLASETGCGLAIVDVRDGQLITVQNEHTRSPTVVRRIEDGEVQAEVIGGLVPAGRLAHDQRRGLLWMSEDSNSPGAAVAYHFDDRTLAPLGMIDLPEAARVEAYDGVSDRLYWVERGRIVSRPADELLGDPPLAELPTTELGRVPGSVYIQTAGESGELTFGIARELTYARDRGCHIDTDRWGLVYRTSKDPRWRVVDSFLPCRLDSGRRFWPAPTFPRSGLALLTVGGNGVYRTVDGGRSWQPAMLGLDNHDYMEVVYSPDNERDHAAFITTKDGRAWRSTDDGASWQPIGQLTALTVLGTAGDRPTLFAAQSHTNEIKSSVDLGTTWQTIGTIPVANGEAETRMLHVLSSAAGQPPVLAAITCASDYQFSDWHNATCQPHRSADGGRTWSDGEPTVEFVGAFIGPLGKGEATSWLLGVQTVTGGNRIVRRFLRTDDLGLTWRLVMWPEGLEDAPMAASPDGRLVVAESATRFRDVTLDEFRVAP